MAEERTLGTARAPETDTADDDLTKAELQRRMEEARESITQTVSEIKDTVTTQYQNVRESISQSLDWREQYRRRPVEFSVAALGVGVLLGYTVGGALLGDGSELNERYYDAEGDDYDMDESVVRTPSERAYASQAILGGAYGSTAYAQPQAATAAAPARAEASSGGDYDAPQPRPSYSSGYEATPAESSLVSSEPQKPGLFERFKETQAYDKLQAEVATLGSRAVEELSKTAQSVVLPALLGKLKDLIGIDLSAQREVAQRSKLEHEATAASAATTSAQEGQAKAGGSGSHG
ncbi:MAG TPA: hypothetical protein VGO96_13010 [Pyrinomonadaceae bacterium]|jgi:hypothetical protein|nr:hypothetical protein [Pyrinomonadaceae bacterium]